MPRKYKIAICHTKNGDNAKYVNKAFKMGLAACGDQAYEVKNNNDYKFIDKCDAIFMISYPFLTTKGYKFCDEYGDQKLSAFKHAALSPSQIRLDVFKRACKNHIRAICLDSGVMHFSKRPGLVRTNYYQMGYDCIKGLGQYYNKKSPPDRFKKLGLKVKPWRSNGDHILLVGQVRFGVGSQHIDIYKWYHMALNEIRQYTDRPVIFRAHPNDIRHSRIYQDQSFDVKYSKHHDLASDLKNAWCTVSFSSHAAVESIMKGVPCISCSKLSMTYPETAAPISQIENPPIFSREQFLYNLAYTQWHPNEIAEGKAWGHLRPFIDDIKHDDFERLLAVWN